LAIDKSGISHRALAKRSGLSRPTIDRFLKKHREFSYDTAIKLADAIGFDLKRDILRLRSAEPLVTPSPWDTWDASICPVHVRDDHHLVVFGRDKGPVRKKSARELFGALAARYPGGFSLKELEGMQIATDFRGILSRWREKDDDCRAAIQLPRTKSGGLYRYGPPS
jgi:transcriptional regulator with XRE-family HTH domain